MIIYNFIELEAQRLCRGCGWNEQCHLVIRDGERKEFAALQDSLSAELDPRCALEAFAFTIQPA
jgi:hypothetical protein